MVRSAVGRGRRVHGQQEVGPVVPVLEETAKVEPAQPLPFVWVGVLPTSVTVHHDRQLGDPALAQAERAQGERVVEIQHPVETEALIQQPHLLQPPVASTPVSRISTTDPRAARSVTLRAAASPSWWSA